MEEPTMADCRRFINDFLRLAEMPIKSKEWMDLNKSLIDRADMWKL